MRQSRAIRWAVVGSVGLWLLATTVMHADTIVFRDGRRMQGRLVAIRDGVMEIDTARGRNGRERLRIDQSEVARIEFDDERRGPEDGATPSEPLNPAMSDSRRPAGMREREVLVLAEVPWRDTGITVRAGQIIYFHASGRVAWGPKRQDGPDGERNSPRNDGRPMPSRPGGALIARVGEGDQYFFVGVDPGPVRVRGDGHLYLGINDDFLADNSGAFRVTVFY